MEGKPENFQTVHQLECEAGQCAEWIIDDEIKGPIVVHAAMSDVKKNDVNCWGLVCRRSQS